MKFVFLIIGFGWVAAPSFAMTAQTQNVSSMHQTLDENETALTDALQNYRYSLSVEWDQRDLEMKQEIVNRFSARVDALLVQGMSYREAFITLSKLAKVRQMRIDIEMTAEYAQSHKLSYEEFFTLFLAWTDRI